MKKLLLPFLFIGFLTGASFPEDSVYQLNSTFINDSGQKVNIADLQGQPVIISMAYTGCTYTCPLILSQMQNVEKELLKQGKTNVRFVLISFDFEKDTPAVIKKYHANKKLSEKWSLWTSDSDKSPREVANALGIKYKKMEGGDYDHSFIITALDENGRIKYQQTGTEGSAQEMIKAIKK
ncbi:SCO family protein [Bdellovibrio sp. ArHS]|uniref:SCO family protein n=1 Tax=Bdellovibrio sp. ArHS TaxID=1569284 RepID=UPI000B2D68F9|nr:SCO family protein [Bdellovibrio sp. ArHS]